MSKQEPIFTDAVLQAKNILLIIVDETNTIVRINDTVSEIFGDKFEIGKNILDVIIPKYKHELIESISKVYNNEEVTVFSSISPINDTMIYIDWTFTPFFSTEGDKYIAGIGINVTEKYKTAQNLKEYEEMVRVIMSYAQDAIIFSNELGNIVVVNKATENMFGYSSQELQGQPVIPTIIPKEYEEEFLEDIKSGLTLEIYGVHKNSNRFPIELSISQITILEHKSTLYIIRDVTARKQKEAEVFKALEKAKSAEKAKSEFLANMSHEIRTPLNGIIGFLNLLKQTNLDETQMEYLQIINSSSESLLSIINDILDYSKFEHGKMHLEKVEFNSTTLFEEVTNLYAAKASEKGIGLLVILDEKTPEWIIGDPLRLRQILSNLLSNAIKFTNSGGNVTLRATVINIENNKCVLRISVKDTGIGISKEKQSLIFEAFSQADASITRKYGGSGLGLAICVSIAQLMGDGLQLDSNEGEGSDFYFNASFEIGDRQAVPKPIFNDVTAVLYECDNETCIFKRAIIEYLTALKCKVETFHDLEDIKNIEKFDLICMGYRTTDKDLIEGIKNIIPEKPTIYIACDLDVGNIRHLESKTVRVISQPLNISKFLDAFTFLIRKNTTITHAVVDKGAITQTYTGHVLIVEDNPVNRRLADIIFRQLGLTVELAVNGQEGLNLFLKNKYDIIFMDIHMPVLDGISATKEIIRIEQEKNIPHTPIVALTANVIPEDRDTYIQAGMDYFLAKPIEKHKLEEILNNLLYSKEAQVMMHKIGAMFESTDLETIKNIFNEFYKVAEKQIAGMRNALKDNDIKNLAFISGSLRGASMNLRFNNIVSATQRIEGHVAKGTVTDYESIINDVEVELAHIKRIIG